MKNQNKLIKSNIIIWIIMILWLISYIVCWYFTIAYHNVGVIVILVLLNLMLVPMGYYYVYKFKPKMLQNLEKEENLKNN